MSNDNLGLIAAHPANSANAFDLRRVGANPEHWYSARIMKDFPMSF